MALLFSSDGTTDLCVILHQHLVANGFFKHSYLQGQQAHGEEGACIKGAIRLMETHSLHDHMHVRATGITLQAASCLSRSGLAFY